MERLIESGVMQMRRGVFVSVIAIAFVVHAGARLPEARQASGSGRQAGRAEARVASEGAGLAHVTTAISPARATRH